ncbi:MAG: hypothetical protein ACFCVA_19145 [Gammaproteobacteria bacterium]
MFKLIGDIKPLPKVAEDVLNEGDPLIVFAVNAKGETRAYRTRKAASYGVKQVRQAPKDAADLIRQFDKAIASESQMAAAKSAPQRLIGEGGKVLEAALEGSPGCYWKWINGTYVWVCE